MSGGGTGSDGVDAMATLSANSDELQILVYNTAAAFATTGSGHGDVNVSNLPTALADKELFVTHFRVDETHSNPYSVWVSQNRPTAPTEAQWQAMKAAAAPRAALGRSARRPSPPRTRRRSPFPGRRGRWSSSA